MPSPARRSAGSLCSSVLPKAMLPEATGCRPMTLRSIMGLWQPSQGELLFDGQPLRGLSTPEIAQRGIDRKSVV